MSIKEKLNSIEIPLYVIAALLIIVPLITFFGGVYYDRKYTEPKISPTPIPKHIFEVTNTDVHGTCPKYSVINNPEITPPPNFPGHDKSHLTEFIGEITYMIGNEALIQTPRTRGSIYIDSETIILGKKDFSVGDCVYVLYGVSKKGPNKKTFLISPQ